jgi:excisionase family DNA binding protein
MAEVSGEKEPVVEQLFTAEQLAEHIGIPVSTVKYWRKVGRGPRITQLGKHYRYRESDVQAWVEQESQRTRQQRESRFTTCPSCHRQGLYQSTRNGERRCKYRNREGHA